MPKDRLGIYFLDVGQGDCSFVVGPDGGAKGAVLFDCSDAYVAERFVKDHGIRHLTAVVVSHLDRDHIGGLLPFLRNFLGAGGQVGGVYISIDRDVKSLSQTSAELLDQCVDWESQKKLSLAPSHRSLKPQRIYGGKDCEAVTKTPAHNDSIKVGNVKLTALHTPCHTQDSICWFAEDGSDKAVFSGDTLFIGGLFWRLLTSFAQH